MSCSVLVATILLALAASIDCHSFVESRNVSTMVDGRIDFHFMTVDRDGGLYEVQGTGLDNVTHDGYYAAFQSPLCLGQQVVAFKHRMPAHFGLASMAGNFQGKPYTGRMEIVHYYRDDVPSTKSASTAATNPSIALTFVVWPKGGLANFTLESGPNAPHQCIFSDPIPDEPVPVAIMNITCATP